MTPPSTIRAVTFDIGGTLIAPTPSVGVIYAEVAATVGVTLPADVLDARFRDGFHQASASGASSAEKGFWEDVVRYAFAPANLPASQFRQIFEAAYATFGEGRRWKVFEGVPEILETLRTRGFRLAALSNADARFHSALRDLGLTQYFETVFLSGDVGFEKPDVRIFRHVEKALGLPPENLLHVGDSMKHDIDGARKAGWTARIVGGDHAISALAEDPLLQTSATHG